MMEVNIKQHGDDEYVVEIDIAPTTSNATYYTPLAVEMVKQGMMPLLNHGTWYVKGLAILYRVHVSSLDEDTWEDILAWQEEAETKMQQELDHVVGIYQAILVLRRSGLLRDD